MSHNLYQRAGELAESREPFAIATVVRVVGSSSAKQGSKAIINSQGRIVTGWVGGGCAESTVRAEAMECIKAESPRLITLDMQDEVLGVGMPCGGRMEVYIEPVLPKPELVIAGHGRIAETLAELGNLMSFSVTVHDPFAERERFPHADRVIDKDFGLTEISFGSRSFVVIATLHKNDHLWLQRALEGKAAYVALIASAHRARLVLDYLLAEGMPPERVESVWSPAGLDLGAASPEEIALSIMSQIVAVRRKAGGQSILSKKEAVSEAMADQESADSNAVIRKCETPTRD
jgi:xanthine dehydrogenase accessory factor